MPWTLTSRSFLSCCVLLSLTGCAPELVHTYLTPDNAPARERAAAAKRAADDPSKLAVTEVDAKELADLVRGDLTPLCRAENGHAVAGVGLDDVRAGIAAWTAARSAAPADASAKTAKNGASLSVSTSSDTVTWTAKTSEMRAVDAVDVECSGDRPSLAINGKRHDVGELYGKRVITGANLGLGAAATTSFVIVAGYDPATSQLVAVRVQTAHKSRLKDPDAKRWNGAVVRSLKGFVPDGATPSAARWEPGKEGNFATLEIVFAADKTATLFRAPVSFTADDTEGIEVVRVRQK